MSDAVAVVMGVAFISAGLAGARETWIQVKYFRRTGRYKRRWIMPKGWPKSWTLAVWVAVDVMLVGFDAYLVVSALDG